LVQTLASAHSTTHPVHPSSPPASLLHKPVLFFFAVGASAARGSKNFSRSLTRHGLVKQATLCLTTLSALWYYHPTRPASPSHSRPVCFAGRRTCSKTRYTQFATRPSLSTEHGAHSKAPPNSPPEAPHTTQSPEPRPGLAFCPITYTPATRLLHRDKPQPCHYSSRLSRFPFSWMLASFFSSSR